MRRFDLGLDCPPGASFWIEKLSVRAGNFFLVVNCGVRRVSTKYLCGACVGQVRLLCPKTHTARRGDRYKMRDQRTSLVDVILRHIPDMIRIAILLTVSASI